MVKRTDLNLAKPSIAVNSGQQILGINQPDKIILESHASRIGRYAAFLEALKPSIDVVYVPCFGTEIAHIDAFSNSRRIINVEFLEDSVQELRKLNRGNIEAYCVDAKTFNPGEPVDILILWNQSIDANLPAQYVVNGGYVLCNDYHSAASDLRKNNSFQLVGIVSPDFKLKEFVLDTENPDDYWKEIDTEEELRNAKPSWETCTYDYALNVVEQVTGKTDNVLDRYKELYEVGKPDELFEEVTTTHRAVAQFAPSVDEYIKEIRNNNSGFVNLSDEQILDMPASTQRLKVANADDSFIVHNGRFVPLMKLPKKKGDIDDLFVFKRIS